MKEQKKIVYLIGNFHRATIKAKNAMGFASTIDNKDFGDGKLHPVDVGDTRFVFRSPDPEILEKKKGRPDVFIFPETAGQTFVLKRDGDFDVMPS